MDIDRSTPLSNNTIMDALGYVYFNEGVRDEGELVEKVSEWYDETSPDKHEEHLREIQRAAEKFMDWREDWKSTHAIKPRAEIVPVSREELMQFRETQVFPLIADEWLKTIEDSDTQKHSAREGLEAIFKYGRGWLWVGEDKECKGHWMPIEQDGERFDWQFNGNKYIVLSTFPESHKSSTERTGKNTDKICAVMMEIDGDKTKDEYKSLKEADQKEYRRDNLLKTCRVLASIGISPTTITFSGSKSYHCVFRLREPICPKEFEDKKKMLSAAYKALGVDATSGVRNPVITRFPVGNRGVGDVLEPQQRLMYVDANAEVGFDEWCAALSKFVKVEEAQVRGNFAGPMVLVGDDEDRKWIMSPATWKKYLDDKGIYVIRVNGEDNIYRREDGILQRHDPMEMFKLIYDEVRAVNEKASDEFSKKTTALLKENLGEYAVNQKTVINKSKDDFESVHIPYKNGLLIVHPSGHDFSKGDFKGNDYFGTEPSTKRDFVYTEEKSEYETLIERTCGVMENDPRWQDRKLSIESYLGYLISGAKEPTNYMGIFTEQSMTSMNGQSGKGLIINGVGHVRSMLTIPMKDMANYDKRRWVLSSYNNQSIVFLDDAYEGINLEEYFNMTTGDFAVEKKGRDIQMIPFEDAPKLVMATNYFPRITGASKVNRFPMFEITNHYTASHNPESEFGHWLFSDAWTSEEWHRFDSYMMKCVQVYLNNRIIRFKSENMLEKAFMADSRIDDQTRDFLDLFFENHDLAGFYTYNDFEVEMRKFTGNNLLKLDSRDFSEKVFVWCDLTGKSKCERHRKKDARGLKFSVIESVVNDTNDDKTASSILEPAQEVEEYSDADPLFGGLISKKGDDGVKKDGIVTPIVTPIVTHQLVENKPVKDEGDADDGFFTILGQNDDQLQNEKINNKRSSELEKTVTPVTPVTHSENERFFLDTYDRVKKSLRWFGNTAYYEIEEDGRLKWQVVYCRGSVPPPVGGRYTICGSMYEADGVGRVKGNEKIVFVEVV